ncbi:hypothetical protein KC19_8G124000 [Ceratodon purpureus]|uniref:Uncharacterized protein n=1 Tax=Ceratodon purpureus TaxID=3225 RepID=A0A8T0H1C8_CERPU|nr:hypothetical protein KC19_8G124000 [Ceratodon purpureus]
MFRVETSHTAVVDFLGKGDEARPHSATLHVNRVSESILNVQITIARRPGKYVQRPGLYIAAVPPGSSCARMNGCSRSSGIRSRFRRSHVKHLFMISNNQGFDKRG